MMNNSTIEALKAMRWPPNLNANWTIRLLIGILDLKNGLP